MDETIDNEGIDEDNDETNDKTIDEDNKDKDNKNESKDKTNDLSILLKSFNRLDNYIARYIYKKYIAQDSSFLEKSRAKKQDSSFLEKSRAKKQDSSFLEKSRAKNYDEISDHTRELEGLKPSHKHTEIKIENFLKTIFNIERPGIITQKESLETDLYKMDIADKAYDKDPKKFKLRQYESVPDVKRCSFIRKHKNKYKRCNIHVMNDDSDICYKHIDSPNIYWDRYCEVLDEIKNIEV